MVPTPVAIGMVTCEKVIVEERTRNISLVSCFDRIVVGEFPTAPQRFAVFATLKDGEGNGTITLVITHLESDEEIYAQEGLVHFPNRLSEVRALFRVNACRFPTPGRYLVSLLVDGAWISQREIEAVAKEDLP
jgi:hypothetical protein